MDSNSGWIYELSILIILHIDLKRSNLLLIAWGSNLIICVDSIEYLLFKEQDIDEQLNAWTFASRHIKVKLEEESILNLQFKQR